jgi:hypothetical protein
VNAYNALLILSTREWITVIRLKKSTSIVCYSRIRINCFSSWEEKLK